VLRSTHVLRGKVCSQKSYERGVFLFNTWQQFADGRKRTRNGLLSEKLSTAETPLQDHLHEVCKRAVEEEEMQRVVEASVVIGPHCSAPGFDPEYRCPLTVVDQHFVDYTIEVGESKSFPGLLTAYHLYTVDIICNGLPGIDFNTLEYEDPDPQGQRKLKYIHAWNWLDWSMIRRYLFEGSTLKETRRKGSFTSEAELETWLQQLGVDTEQWCKDGFKSVRDLLREVEHEEAQLELWGRHDGVSLLMRVVHVLQLKVVDPSKPNKILFQTWHQTKDGRARSINRLIAKKLSCSQVPFDEDRFAKAAKTVIQNQLSHITDVHFHLTPANLPTRKDVPESEIWVTAASLGGMHYDIQESPTFKGMQTMYHMYTMDIECEGLPTGDNFTSLDFDRPGGPFAYGWRWMSLPQTLDVLHARAQAFERQDSQRRRALATQRQKLEQTAGGLDRLVELAQRLAQSSDPSSQDAGGSLPSLLAEAAASLRELGSASRSEETATVAETAAESLPPAMLSKMASDTVAPESVFEEAMARQSSMFSARSMRAVSSYQSVDTSISEGRSSLVSGSNSAPMEGGVVSDAN